ncbi:MAG: ABC transporter ATP-binding protein [Paracoccaceae bacterium]
MTAPLLSVEDLHLRFHTDRAPVQALRGVSLAAHAGEVIGIVGESGCGKSTLVTAMIGLMGVNAEVTGGAVRCGGTDLLSLPESGRRKLRGQDIAVVFQDPMTAFNPVITLGDQLVDFQHQRQGISRAEKRAQAEAMLARVGIADAALTMGRFAHEMSGGMRQRAAIAAALLMTPSVLIADEPTTALDVTMEAQIIHLLRELRQDYHGAIIVVTHHLGVIGELCDRVYVMYAGEVVEEGLVDDIYHAPRHPYTRALIECDPAHIEGQARVLPTIPGRLPDLSAPPTGCSFAARCPIVTPRCHVDPPPYVGVSATQFARCHEVQP